MVDSIFFERMNFKRLILILLVLGAAVPARAKDWNPVAFLLGSDSLQSKPHRYSFFAIRYHAGKVLQTNDFLRGENLMEKPINSFHALEISYGVQTDGSKAWHHLFNFPYYGISFYNANFFNSQELGYPTALFGFMGFPVSRVGRSTWGYELGFGLTYNWKAYDPYKNPFNVAIGSHRTVYIGLNAFYSYQFADRWELKTGLGFTHFSNGATKKPNSGINLVSPFVEVNYSLHDRPLLIRSRQADYSKNYEFALQFGVGEKQEIYKNPDNDELKTVGSFSVVNISLSLMKQRGWKSKYGLGLDLTNDTQGNLKITYDESGLPVLHKSSSAIDQMKMGVFGTYEFCVDRLSIASYLGVYVIRKDYPDQAPALYQKFGLKYHFKNNMFVGLLVRAGKFTVADVIEWNVGYRLKWD